MQIPDGIVTEPIALKDQYFDLMGLVEYSSLGLGTCRDYIRSKGLPCFKVGGKILVKRSEFDKWIERYRHTKTQDLDTLVDGIMADMKS